MQTGDLLFSPIYAFEEICESYRLKRSALLIIDHSGDVFVPVASSGFDVTTQRRLRIPSQILKQNHRLVVGETITIGREGMTFLEPFFSVREFALVEALRLIPLRHGRMLFGILLHIAHSGEENVTRLDDLKRAVVERESTVYAEYTGRLSELPVAPAEFRDIDVSLLLGDELASAVTKDTRLLCLLLRISALIASFDAVSVQVNHLRIRDDIARILYSFVFDGGFLAPCKPDELLLCIRTRHVADTGFVLQHIESTLSDFYPSLVHVTHAIRASAWFPDDASDTGELLRKLRITPSDD